MAAGTYSDAPTQILATFYEQGKEFKAMDRYAEAIEAFVNSGSYSDAEAQILSIYSEFGLTDADTEVYVTPAGKYYHSAKTCSYMQGWNGYNSILGVGA